MAGPGHADEHPVHDREWYRQVVEQASTVTAVLDRDGIITYASDAAERVLGYAPETLIGTDGCEYVHPSDLDTVQATSDTLFETPEQSQTVAFRFRQPDGSWRWIEAAMRNQLDNDVIGGILLHGRDITDRKERESECLADRERMKMALAGANIGVWDWDMVTDEVSRDELLTEMLGYTNAEMGNDLRGWEERVHPAGKRRHDEALAEHVTERTPYYECEYRLETKSGEWKWVRTIGKVVEYGADGSPERAIGIHQDIDDRKRAELALEERERKYRNLFENTRDALMLLDRDGYRDCNERTLELFGVGSVADFLTYAPWDLSPPTQPTGQDSKDAALAHIEHAFKEGEAFFEFVHQRVDGTTFPAEVKLSRFEHEDGQALHALVRDITERKEYEQHLQAQRDDLSVLNQVLRHDIRNDIQLITSHAELLAENSDEDIQYHVDKILENADHAIELTNSAREMADVMLSAERELQPIGLRETIEAQLANLQSTYPDAVITTTGTIPSVEVQAHDTLSSVFRNLLKNAVQHNDAATPKVTVSATRQNERVVVRVVDNGPGIPDNRKAAVFGKGEAGLDSHGTGIGLYLVKTLVESYGGDVWIEDRERQDSSQSLTDDQSSGTAFVVELPLAAGA